MFNKIASLRQEKRFLGVFSICVSKSIAEFCCLPGSGWKLPGAFVSFLALSQR